MSKYKESIFNIQVDERSIYNAYSGAIIRVQKPITESITAGENTDLLSEQGFIVDERVNELNRYILERNTAIFSRRNRGLKYVIALTNDCQAHCSYCFERGVDRKRSMDVATAQKVISFIEKQAQKYNAQSIQITYFGGEPLLNFEALSIIGSKMQTFCENKDIRFASNIITNGIALTKERAQKLVELGVNFAQITLDGTRNVYREAKGIDAFDTVVGAIQDVGEILPLDIRLNITRSNMHDIVCLIEELLFDRGLAGKVQLTLAQVVDYIGCQFNSTLCLDGEEFAEFVRNIYLSKESKSHGSLKKATLMPKVLRTFCGMENCAQYVIGTQGELYKCEHSVGKDSEVVGDIEIGSYYADKEMEFYSEIPSLCLRKKCPFLPMCLGGCANERIHNKHIRDCEQEKRKHLLLLQTYLQLLNT